jgi:acyl carrier protein
MTEPTSIEATVLEVVSDVLGESADDLRALPVLAAHNWDSVASLEVLAALESRLGISLDLRSYHAAREIDDLVDLITTAVAEQAAPTHR